MIPYKDLCDALKRSNAGHQDASEVEQLDQESVSGIHSDHDGAEAGGEAMNEAEQVDLAQSGTSFGPASQEVHESYQGHIETNQGYEVTPEAAPTASNAEEPYLAQVDRAGLQHPEVNDVEQNQIPVGDPSGS